MAIEIERKFRVVAALWAKKSASLSYDCIQQAYLSNNSRITIRVRIKETTAFLTLKSTEKGLQRQEFEYSIPLQDAKAMLALCSGAIIQKKRYYYPLGSHVWEIDVFEGPNQGLIVAEIELQDQNERFDKPAFVAEEVSLDTKYRNLSLSQHPFCTW
jgi:adenylate cyclase